MWRAFAVFYCLLATFGAVLGGYVLASRPVWTSAIGLSLASVAFVMVLLTAVGLVAYAFKLNAPPYGLWRPLSWIIGVYQLLVSLLSVVRFAQMYSAVPAGSDVGVTNLIWLVLGLALNYFSWLGVWRHGQRMAQQPAPAG
ncbi:hypothetical protein PWG15_10915 [Ensifer adhaerens]|uniref:hypothetical protein n=1 Tax=Ensifer adhaerens TaxID=106592 RepID=UPI0023A9EEA7|nr:hypothetical protein [Ensifer adhaerens]WDZ75135.1 hypothetical protein PWG15_10915 [Ensifer adhaerens]